MGARDKGGRRVVGQGRQGFKKEPGRGGKKSFRELVGGEEHKIGSKTPP